MSFLMALSHHIGDAWSTIGIMTDLNSCQTVAGRNAWRRFNAMTAWGPRVATRATGISYLRPWSNTSPKILTWGELEIVLIFFTERGSVIESIWRHGE